MTKPYPMFPESRISDSVDQKMIVLYNHQSHHQVPGTEERKKRKKKKTIPPPN